MFKSSSLTFSKLHSYSSLCLSLPPLLLLSPDASFRVWNPRQKKKKKSQFFTRAGHWGSSTGSFSLAVIKFVSELLDLSLIHRFLQPEGSRYWRVSSDLTGQRRRCGIGIALLHSTTEIWFATSRSTCWYDVLTDCREVYTTVAFFFFSFPLKGGQEAYRLQVFLLCIIIFTLSCQC